MSLLAYGYVQRALIASALVGFSAPAVGVFIVQRRLSLLGDGVGHVAFAGAAVGALTGTAPVITAAVAAVAGGIAIEILRSRGRAESDVALAVIFYGGIATGVLLTSIARSPASSLIGFLFGSVLTVSTGELVVVGVLAVVVVGVTGALRRVLFGVCYDEELARVSGLPVRALNFVIAISAAATIAIAMRVVGALLIAALMVLPVATTQRFVRSFGALWFGSLVVGGVVAVGGLGASLALDSAPGATIVVAAVALLLVSVMIERVRTLRA